MVSAYIELNLVPARKNIKEVTGYSYTSFLRAGFTISSLLKLVPKKEKPKKFCINCGKEILGFGVKFCSQSCSAVFSNKGRNRHKDKPKTTTGKTPRKIICKAIGVISNTVVTKSKNICQHCGELTSNPRFCSTSCQKAYRAERAEEDWLEGRIPGWTGATVQLKKLVKRYLHRTRGTACEVCGWDERHPVDGAVLTEIDHIDGNAKNCSPENLRILCPNCHSKTPTHRARNKNSQRKRK